MCSVLVHQLHSSSQLSEDTSLSFDINDAAS